MYIYKLKKIHIFNATFHGSIYWHAPGITKPPGGTRWELRPGAPGAFEAFFIASLDGGNSNIFYFHPEIWGNDPI